MLKSIISNSLLFSLLFISNLAVNGQNATLDPSFGVNGVASFQYGIFGIEGGTGMLLQPDKKILVTGYSIVSNAPLPPRTYFIVARLNENGSIDNSFGVNGFFAKDLGPHSSVQIEIQGRRIALQPDGKIVATCAIYNQARLFNDILVLRLNSNGTLDNTFGTGGTKQFNIGDYGDGGTCILMQPDGKLLVGAGSFVGGNRHYAVVRLNSNGSFDNSFKSNGVSKFQIGPYSEFPTCMILQADGKILVGGSSWYVDYEMTLIRLKTNGDLDETFTGDGWMIVPIGGDDALYDMAMQTDGKIVLAGWSVFTPNLYFALARVDANGSIDYTFDNDGRATYHFGNSTNHGYAVELQSDGKILIAGDTYSTSTAFDYGLMRINTNGSFDSTFDGDGKKIFPLTPTEEIPSDLVIQSDGKILMSGKGSGGIMVARTNVIDPMQADCRNITIAGGEQFIGVSGLGSAPIATVQVFNSSWTSVFNQTYSDSTDQVNVSALPGGNYFVRVAFYSPNWSLLCSKDGYFTVSQSTSLPVVAIETAKSVTETNGTVGTLTVSIPQPSDMPVSVNYTTVNGTAISGSDYIAKSGTLTIPVGSTAVTISVDLMDDNTPESNETFLINISNPLNGVLGNTSGTVTIIDNDQTGPNCNSIIVNAQSNGIVVSGLSAPNVTIQVFNSNWLSVFSNSSVHPDSINVPIETSGTYFVKTTFYSASWSLICDKSEFVTVSISQPNTCPPGAICISNKCNSATVNLDSAYSIPNLPSGAMVTWHTGTPATDNNKLTMAQAQNVAQSGVYYAALNISGSNCYSSTIMVIVTIKECNATLTAPIAHSMQREQSEKAVRVIPNPFTNTLKIEIESMKQEMMKLSLVNVNGQELRIQQVQLKVGNNQVWLRGLESLPSGPYFIRMISSTEIKTYKLFRQK